MIRLSCLRLAGVVVIFTFLSGCGGSSSGGSGGSDGPPTGSPTPGVSIVSGIAMFSENAGSSSIDFVLDTAPDGTVIIDLVNTDATEASLSSAQITFDVGTWNIPQTVDILGVNDDVADGNQMTSVTAAINAASLDSTGYVGLILPSQNFTVIDDDMPGFTVTSVTTSFSELSGTGSFNLVLNSQPDNDVTINISSSDLTEATVATAVILFTVGDWMTPQAVNLNGVNDNLSDGNQVFAIDFAVALPTADTTGYDSVAAQPHNITVTDDDTAGVTVSPLSLSLVEGGANGTFNVRLNTEPVGSVIIDVISSDTSEATVDTAQLTFNNLNWNMNKPVIVSPQTDAITDPNQNITIQLTMNVSSTDNTGYSVIDPADVAVNVTEIQPILIFNAGLRDGNMSGRIGVDKLCGATKPAACGSRTNVHGYIGVSSMGFGTNADLLKNMAINYGYYPNVPIQSVSGVVLASNWAGMFTGTIPQSLSFAEVLPASTSWWSGSSESGGNFLGGSSNLDSSNCTSWTTNGSAPLNKAFVGLSNATDFKWIIDGVKVPGMFTINDVACNTPRYLLCACGELDPSMMR